MTLTHKPLLAALVAAALTGCVINTAGVANIPGGTGTGSSTDGKKTDNPVGTNGNLANRPVTGVSVSQDTLVIQAKKSQQVTATVKYADGSSDSNVNWSSDDNQIAAVNATNGTISAIKPGNVTIRAKSANDPNKFALINVSVKEGEVEAVIVRVTPETANIGIGETVQLSAEVQTSNGKTNPNGSWSSSNSPIATVSGDGLVTGLKAGKVTVTFTSDEKSTVKASATITVGGGAASPTPAPTASPAN